MVEIFVSEHENKLVVPIKNEFITGNDFLDIAIEQLEQEENQFMADKIKRMKSEVENNQGRKFFVDYDLVSLRIPVIVDSSKVSFHGNGKNGYC